MITIKNVKRIDGSIGDVSLDNDCSQEIEGKGLTLLPALIDPHVHFRVPGGEYKEDWITGSLAAISGGVTCVIDMPNNRPSCSTLVNLQEKHRLIKKQLQEGDIPIRPFLYFGADKNHLKEIPRCKGLCIGIKVFMGSSTGDLLIDNDKDLLEIFRMAADLDLPVAIHAEDEKIIAAKKKEYTSLSAPSVHSKIRCREAAIHATEKALNLAHKIGTKLIVLHVSTKEELALIREAKSKKVAVHAEAAPHHLFLTTFDYRSLGNKALVNPPLREKEDQESLWNAIRDGTIDFIGSDHAPHTLEDKEKKASGVPGIEFILPLMLTAVSEGKITLQQLVQLTRKNAETIFKIPPNQDYVLVKMDHQSKVQKKDIKSKCRWSPYIGMNVIGRPLYTIVQGRVFQLDKVKR